MRVHSSNLDECEGVSHGFFTREGGVSAGIYASLNCGPGSGDDPAAVQENRKRVVHMLCHPEPQAKDLQPQMEILRYAQDDKRLCTLHQIHSPDVITVTSAWNERPKADAMVTATPGIILGILTADCGPVLFCDPDARVVGAAHAGWKGAIGGVLENTISAMETLGANRERIIAALGPCIAQKSYEVGTEFYQRFAETSPLYGTFFRESANPGHFHFDLSGFILHRLAQSGLQHAQSLAMDTYSDPRFFSYRRTTHAGEPDYGRQISAIMIKD